MGALNARDLARRSLRVARARVVDDRDRWIRLALGRVRGARDVGPILHRHDGEGDATADPEDDPRHCEEEQALLPVHVIAYA
jgi:hypothetical protein